MGTDFRFRVSPSLLAASCALALLVSSCADSGAASTVSSGSEAPFTASAGDNSPPILVQMEGVLDTTAFRGVRRVVQRQGDDWLEQLEDVGADGTGQFAIELSDVLTYPPGVDPNAYDILFESAARFHWSMRDFQVHDAALAGASYLITLQSAAPVVAGIPCVRLSFLRRASVGDRPGQYEADVDPSTGFVLAWREFDGVGSILAETTYESFAYNGDLSDMTLRGRSFAATGLSLAAPLEPQAGFATHLPDVLPGDMQFSVAEVQVVPHSLAAGLTPGALTFLPVGNWLRLIATDGIESVVFAHASRPASAAPTLQPMGELHMYEKGTWEIGYGRLDGTAYVVAGRVTMGELRQIIASAF